MKKSTKPRKRARSATYLNKQKNKKALKVLVTMIGSYFVYLSHINKLPKWTMLPSLMLMVSMWMPSSWAEQLATILSYVLTPIYVAHGYIKGWYNAYSKSYKKNRAPRRKRKIAR